MPNEHALLAFFVDKLAEALLRRSNGPRVSAAAPKAGRHAKGSKRSSLRITRATTALLAHIKANPGQRLEQISAALNIPTSELKYPAQKLLAEGLVKTKGAKRGTTYFST